MEEYIALPNPKSFDVSAERGFLPKRDPLTKLPDGFKHINQIAQSIPELLQTKTLRRELDSLPPTDLSPLRSARQLECAMRSYSYFASAYVYSTYEGPAEHIPAGVAVPLCYLAKRLNRKPILSYYSYSPYNWRLLDKKGAVALGNLAPIQNFLGDSDENWFVIVHVEIEAHAGPGLFAIPNAQKSAYSNDPEELYAHLRTIAASLQLMHATLTRMPENCNPRIYYTRVRPYIHAFRGIVYEGVQKYKGEPQHFHGETGAQSSIVPCMDAALGVIHADDPLRPYLYAIRAYMPPKHRAYIEAIEKNSVLIRQCVLQNRQDHPYCVDVYNECLYWLWRFRTEHFKDATEYIHKQSQTSSANPTDVGTGDTPFMQYLKKHAEETKAHMIL